MVPSLKKDPSIMIATPPKKPSFLEPNIIKESLPQDLADSKVKSERSLLAMNAFPVKSVTVRIAGLIIA